MLKLFDLPIAEGVEVVVDFLLDHFQPFFSAGKDVVEVVVESFEGLLQATPPWLLILILALIAWKLAGRGVAVFTAVGLWVVWNIELWESTIQTFSLVLTAEAITLLLGLPLGILAAKSEWAERIIKPVLDFMQTMPAFVYLIPAVMFFGLGMVPGVMATVIFSIPPMVRLTNLGIRQVAEDLIEAAEAFGSSPSQRLVKVEMPLAMPTIMAGVNQSIMLALSMVVIAAMIGSGGLGSEVLRGIQRLQIGVGFESGLAVVILAIVLDRITQSFGKTKQSEG